MLNRILIRTGETDYVTYSTNITWVTFRELELKTQSRLLELGYAPPIEIFTYGFNDEFVPIQIGELICESKNPKVVFLEDLETYLKNQENDDVPF